MVVGDRGHLGESILFMTRNTTLAHVVWRWSIMRIRLFLSHLPPITESRPHDSSPSVFDMVSIARVNNTTRPCTVISQCQAATKAAALERKVAVSGKVHASFTGGGGW